MQEGTNNGRSNSGGNMPTVVNYNISLTGGAYATQIQTARVLKRVDSTFENTSGGEKEKATPEQDNEKLTPEQLTEKIVDIVRHLAMIEGQIGNSIILAVAGKSPYNTTMTQLNTNISKITNERGSEFQNKMLACKIDLLEWKGFLSSESCLALDETMKKLNAILADEIGLSSEASQKYTTGIRQDGLELIGGVMTVREINGRETQGGVNFDPEKRVPKKDDSLKVKTEQRGTPVQVQRFIDFINLFIQKVDLVLEKNQLESKRTGAIDDSNKATIGNVLDTKQENIRLMIKPLIVFFGENSHTEFSRDDNMRVNGADHIIAYQRALTLLSIPVTMDGIYGKKTMLAIQKFQIGNNLSSKNGAPGPETTKKILEKLIVLDENLQGQTSPRIETTKIPETPEKQIETYLVSKGYQKVIPGRHLKNGTTITIKDGKAEISWNSFLKNNGIQKRSPEETEILKVINDIFKQSTSK